MALVLHVSRLCFLKHDVGQKQRVTLHILPKFCMEKANKKKCLLPHRHQAHFAMGADSKPPAQLLVTGASGFTGKHFVPAARAHGFDVVCLQSDIRCLNDLRDEIAPTNPTYVLHLAGISNTQCDNVDALHAVNVQGTQNLLQALVDTHKSPRRVLLASSVLVYGTSPKSPVKEDSELIPFNPYAASKIAMEQVGATFRGRLPICIVRPFNYSGVGQPSTFLIPKIVDHFVNKCDVIELGNIKVKREFNDVRYVCDVYIKLLQAPRCDDVYNVCCGQAHTIIDVLYALKEMTGHRIDVKVNPKFVRPRDIAHLYGSTARLEATLGIKPSSASSLDQMLRWMVDVYTECGDKENHVPAL